MATVCISNCEKDTGSTPFPRSAKYVNLYKWPESADPELIRTMSSPADEGGGGHYYFLHPPPRVVDSVSCRQMYLRSAYTFSRKESVQERTKKCFGKVKERVATVASARKFQPRPAAGGTCWRMRSTRIRTKFVMVKRVKEFSSDALRSVFQRLLSCTTSVDVVEHK